MKKFLYTDNKGNNKEILYPENYNLQSTYLPNVVNEIYFTNLYEYLYNKTNLKILDIGGFLGDTSIFFSSFASTVWVLEPSKELFECLKVNVENNEIKNIIPINAAMWNKDGEQTYFLDDVNNTQCSLIDLACCNGKQRKSSTKTYRFDTFFKEQNIDHIDFLKIDVEGAEKPIIFSEGFKNIIPNVKAILLEIHFFNEVNEIVEYIKSFGFNAKYYEGIPPPHYLFTRN